MRRFFLNIVVATAVVMLMATQVAFAQVPAAANHFRPDLVRAAQAVWGIRAPIPMFSGQIHQESMWRPDVCSPYACGLTQFTPATADWIAQAYGVELKTTDARQARFHPVWAMRAMVRYDKHLYDRSKGHTECDRMWAVLRHYNGGAGHWFKEAANAADPLDRDSVDAQCGTARRSIKHCPESTGYPRRILLQHQIKYAPWGRTVCLS
jgi:hypothetical protein